MSRRALALAVGIVALVCAVPGSAGSEVRLRSSSGVAAGGSRWAGGLGGSITVVHDPDISKQGSTWYVFSTAPGIQIRASEDLVNWRQVGLVFPHGIPAWLAAELPGTDDNIWAPDVSFFGGLWHVYYSKAIFGHPHAAIGVATSSTLDPSDAAYGWTDKGPVTTSPDLDPNVAQDTVVAIDPNLVIDGSGDPWLVWGSAYGGIEMQRVDASTGKLLDRSSPTLVAHREKWFDVVEGANVSFRDGWWWLETSWGFCCQGVDSFYSVHIGRSRDLTGPYLDMAGTPLTQGGGTLLIGSHGNEVGIGHGTIFDTGDGWALLHHYYDANDGGIATMGFTPLVDLDGWPLGVDPDFTTTDDPAKLAPGTWLITRYAENERYKPVTPLPTTTVGLRADGSVAGGGIWRVDGHVLRIEAIDIDGSRVQRDFSFLIDQSGQLALGRDDLTAGYRAQRSGPPPGPGETPTTAPPLATAPETGPTPSIAPPSPSSTESQISADAGPTTGTVLPAPGVASPVVARPAFTG